LFKNFFTGKKTAGKSGSDLAAFGHPQPENGCS
jgi:hypothetical protein